MSPLELLQQAERVTGVREASALLSEAILCERKVDAHLNELLSKRTSVETGVANLKDSLGLLGLMQQHAETIAQQTKQASTLADEVSRRVRELDASQVRVSESMRRLESIAEAERCVEELKDAMATSEYDRAAERIQDFTQLYFAVGGGGDGGSRKGGSILAEDAAGASHALRDSAAVVRETARSLREIVLEKFERAARERDHEQVKRFAAILGPIGLVESGLAAFTKYLVGLVSSRATADYDELLSEISVPRGASSEGRVDFHKCLTNLFRDVAEAVEANRDLIAEAYGADGFVGVLAALHGECEQRATQILRKHIEFRQLARLAEDAGAGDNNGAGAGGEGGSASRVKDFERTVDEVVMLCVRCEEYNSLLVDVLDQARASGSSAAESKIASLPSSPLNCCVRELNAYYTSLEDAYMARTIAMAVEMDECVEGSMTSSLVEDAFFLLQKCSRRGMATGNVQCVCSVLSNVNNHLCNAYLAALRHDNSVYDCLAGTPEDLQLDLSALDNTSPQCKAAQALNNFDVSAEYIKKLKQDLDAHTFEVFRLAENRNRVQSCLSDMIRTSQEFEKIAASTADHVALRLMPRLKPSVDVVQALSFDLSDAEYASREAEDTWLSDFLSKLEDALGWVQPLLTAQNYEHLVHSVLGQVAKRLEALLLQKRFNQLGGLVREKDVRNIVACTSALTQRAVRDKFARLSQMATLLNLETPAEVLDYWGDDAMMWRLTPFEVKRVLKLRTEFDLAAVDALPL